MAAPQASSHLLNFLRLQPTSLPSVSPSSASLVSLLKPLLFSCTATPNALSKRLRQMQNPLRKPLFPSSPPLPSSTPIFCHYFSSSSIAVPQKPSSDEGLGDSAKEAEEDDGSNDAIEQYDEEIELLEDTQMGLDSALSPLEKNREERLKLPSLTVKERKELASFAHSLGKKLKTQLVGKSGVTSNVASSFIETLEANELLKIKIHRSCSGELDDVVKQLEELTGSVAVGQIGRTVIVYRPSVTKLKAEEKRKQARKAFMRKQLKPKLSKERTPKSSRRGDHRGNIRS
ncbi:hypothetical protein L6164_037536 [Bauhinia variegata]|uniref:Uncharacterized protein n=1 Tax=Bauhinia variegata TaxID=167791 RepID=A0ACB9KKD3_BAUVA|nr:hypothetical protein L6164_037536 [Bauhinia variegata]